MKILHVNEFHGNIGGAEKYVSDLSGYLKEYGHESYFLSSVKSENSDTKPEKGYFIAGSYGIRSSLRTVDRVKNILKREKPDILHLHNTSNFISPIVLASLSHYAPVVKTVHDTRLFCPGRLWKVIPKSGQECKYPAGLACSLRGCYPFIPSDKGVIRNLHKLLLILADLALHRKIIDTLIVSSNYMRVELLKNRFKDEKIKIIPMYTNKAMNRTTQNDKKECKFILFTGRLEKIKGVFEFITALDHIRENNWNATIVGDGREKEEAINRAKRLGLSDRITFTGSLYNDEIDSIYTESDIVVIPSMIPESFCLVGIEAMAFSKPVVAFDSGGIDQWLTNGKTGALIKRGDTKALADRILYLLNNPEKANQMGTIGKTTVDRFYRRESHLTALLEVYRKAIMLRHPIPLS